MGETEIERLLVSLVGDGEDYQKMLTDGIKGTEEAAKRIEEHGAKVESIGDKIKGYAKTVLEAVGTYLGIGFLKGTMHEFEAAEQSAMQMTATLRANGRDVEETREKYKKFADQIEEKYGVDDKATAGLLRLAESMNITGDNAVVAAKNAMALSESTGIGQQQAMKFFVTMKTQGPEAAMHISKMIPALKGVKDEAEFMTRYNRLLESGFEMMNERAGTVGGSMARLEEAMGNFREEIGKVVAEAMKPLVDVALDVVKWFNDLPDYIKETVATIGILVVAIGGVATALTIAGTVFNTLFGGAGIWLGLFATLGVGIAGLVVHLGGVGEAMEFVKEKAVEFWEYIKPLREAGVSLFSAIKESMISAFESIRELAVSAFEAMFGSARVNWDAIVNKVEETIYFVEYSLRNAGKFFDIVFTQMALTAVSFYNDMEHFFSTTLIEVVMNAGRYLISELNNWGKVFLNLMDVIKGKKSFGELFDGLEDSMSKMVPLTKREMGGVERVLSESLENQKKEFGQGFENFYAGKIVESILDGIPDEEEEDAEEEWEKTGEKLGGALGKGVKNKDLAAVLYDSAESLKRINEYQEAMAKRGQEGKGPADTIGIEKGGSRFSPAQSMTTVSGSKGSSMIDQVVQQIATAVFSIAAKPTFQLGYVEDFEGA